MGRDEDIARLRELHTQVVDAERRYHETPPGREAEKIVIREEIRVARLEAHALAGNRYVCTPRFPWTMNIDPSGRAVHPTGADSNPCPTCQSPWVGLVAADRELRGPR